MSLALHPQDRIAPLLKQAAPDIEHPRKLMRGLQRWLGAALHSWKRHRMISALNSVNQNWLSDFGINRNFIDHSVDCVVAREIATVAAPTNPNCSNGYAWKLAR